VNIPGFGRGRAFPVHPPGAESRPCFRLGERRTPVQIPPEIIDAMLPMLQRSELYTLPPPATRPMETVWDALNACLLALRMPLYNQRLRKKPLSLKNHERATQQTLILLAAFAIAYGCKQAIVSSLDGSVRSVSFQPRPFTLNWTQEHAISPVHLTRPHINDDPRPPNVSVEDMLFLAAKLVHAISGYNVGTMPDAVTTFSFYPGVCVSVVVRWRFADQAVSAVALLP
jgi:hypothetical protein